VSDAAESQRVELEADQRHKDHTAVWPMSHISTACDKGSDGTEECANSRAEQAELQILKFVCICDDEIRFLHHNIQLRNPGSTRAII
jgi:hypothetical protein